MNSRPAFVVSVLFALTTTACTSDPSLSPTLREDTEAIIGGTVSDPTQDSVVRLTMRLDGGIYICTGTLLASNLVLTARHCVSGTVGTNIRCGSDGVGDSSGAVFDDFPPSAITVGIGVMPARGGGGGGGPRGADLGAATVAGDAGVRPHGMTIIHDSATNLCNHDIALVILDTKIPNAKISPIRLDGPPTQGETFTAVGWGVTDTTASPMSRQQRTNVAVQQVGPGLGVAPNEFLVGETPCEGDSGGPALDSQTQAIIGTVSRGGNGTLPNPNNPASSCTGPQEQNLYTQTAPFKDLIMQAFTQAGADPWIEGQPDPRLAKFGDPCAQSSDCRSNLCLVDKTGAGVCTSDCTTDMCPTGFDCKDNSTLGTKVCSVHVAPPSSGCSTVPSRPWSQAAVPMVLGGIWLLIRRRRAR